MLHHLPEISDEFKEIIDKMIQRDPRDRYQSYERVEDGLRALSTKLKRAKQNR
jgi:serine/threonine protein kinase